MADLLPPIPFHRRRPFPVGRDFSFMVAKSDEFRHTFFNTPNLPFSDQNLNFTGRKIYANGCYWEANVRGAGGVARSKGKEHFVLGVGFRNSLVGKRRISLSEFKSLFVLP